MARKPDDDEEDDDLERPRSRKKKKPEKKKILDHVRHEVKRSVIAIALFAATVILGLARFEKAGVAGHYIYLGLTSAFGWGYYLLPVVTLILGIVFISHHEIELFILPLIGGAMFVLVSLGALDVVFPNKAGFVGHGVGLLENPFGYQAALVILGALMLASLVVTLDIPLRMKSKEKKEDEPVKLKTVGAVGDVDVAMKKVETDAKAAAAEDKAKWKAIEPAVAEPTELPIMNKTAAIMKDYVPPPVTLLRSSVERPTAGDLRANANIIKRTMESFGIPVEMGEINIGPKFTRYTLKPAEGVRLNKLTALGQDLALALAAHPIRIEAPIPGKSLVGIEVPNKTAAMVRLGSLLAYPEFFQSPPLSVILGRDVTGEPISVNIAKMPHMLIAGATGSGKSVTIHTFILSLLFKNSPQTLQFIMIDPKKVELSIYNGIPHLAAPVVTNGKKAVGVFRWATQEMERRYETLLQAGCRDITGYNTKHKDEQIPYLIIVVDELADLMVAYGKDVETAIVRLAQMARAVGIHLILATQRPSVEIITGLIKVNVPCRIALQVASQIDSRTILDTSGAEKLLGGGDMLILSSEFSKPKRLQGAFVTEAEVHAVVDFIKEHNQSKPVDTAPVALDLDGKPLPTTQDLALTPKSDGISFDEFSASNEGDDLYDEAVETVKAAQKASASLLQRRLKVGYARAARLLDLMEEKGIIGPGDGAKAREVFIEKSADELTAADFQ